MAAVAVAAVVAVASNDLVTTVTVDRTTAPVGGSYVWRITVSNVGGGIAFGVNVDVALSANLVYGFSQVNRGSGCKPAAAAGHYTCNLDLLGPSGSSSAQGSDHPRDERGGSGPGVAVGDGDLRGHRSDAREQHSLAHGEQLDAAGPPTPAPKPTLPARS